jgi:hypothetical protein
MLKTILLIIVTLFRAPALLRLTHTTPPASH